jgi:crotonobetainyl-CoA:carnitine CoA-transferase CaiB-like acyl-CoA transferase
VNDRATDTVTAAAGGATACGGLRVLDFSQGMAGPLATMILADHGAEVIKVEPPCGDWARDLPGYLMWNRGKGIRTLDLSSAPDLAHAVDLANSADVVLHDWHPESLRRRGLDRLSLSRANPGLVSCSIRTAPAHRPDLRSGAYEAGLAARDGRMVGLDLLSGAAVGQNRPAPLFPAAPVASYGAAMLAVQGILAALYRRARTGDGQDVSTSLMQADAAFLLRQDLARGGADRKGVAGTPPAVHRGIVLSFLTAECSDGRYIQLCARQDAHFRNWMVALDMADVLEDPRYVHAPLGIEKIADIEALEVRIRERMRQRTQAEWMELFSTRYDVGADPFLTPDEFLRHPQMLANDRIAYADHPTLGRITAPGPLVLMSHTPARAGRLPTFPVDGWHEAAWAADPRPAARPQPGVPADGGPLSGVTVLELAYFVAGPLSATMLAELGARVIKVEPLEGDPSRRTGLQNAKFLAGKESIALDLKSASGRRILEQLMRRSDALVHNFRPGVPERLGFGYADARRINPRLVYLYGASYGSRGPQAHRTAFHSTPNALCGGGILQAGAGNPPVDDSYCDPGSGLAAATGLLLGLAARERTGRGQYLETSMLSSGGYIHSNHQVRWDGAPDRALPDRGQHGLGATYRLCRCRSGWIFLSAWRDRDFRLLAEALGRDDWLQRDELTTLPGRRGADAELTRELEQIFNSRSAADWARTLGLADSVVTEVGAEPLEVWFERNDLLAPMDHPEFGPYWQPVGKVDFDGETPAPAPTCSLGEHTARILGELGFPPQEIDDLAAQGVIRLAG